ncbi:hypothetical protein STENM223S_03894 [Streptomyces tendae]
MTGAVHGPAPLQSQLQHLLHGQVAEQAPLDEPDGEGALGRVVVVPVRGTRPDGRDTGLLRLQHRVVDPALDGREPAADRQGPGDVGGVEVAGLHTGVEQQQIAVAHRTVVAHPVDGGGVRSGGGDRVVADVVPLDPGPQEERALDVPLRRGPRLAEGAHDVLEAPGGGLAGEAQIGDLEVVLHPAHLGEEDPELLVALRGDLVPERLLDTGVVAPQQTDRARALRQHVREGAHVTAGQTEQPLVLAEAVAAPVPQLAPVGEPELAVGPVGAREQEDGRLVSAFLPRLQDQDTVLRLVTRQVHVVGGGTEPVDHVVGARLQGPGRDDQALPGETGGQFGPAAGGVPCLGDRPQVRPLGVGPAPAHVRGEFLTHLGVQTVLAPRGFLARPSVVRFLGRERPLGHAASWWSRRPPPGAKGGPSCRRKRE